MTRAFFLQSVAAIFDRAISRAPFVTRVGHQM